MNRMSRLFPMASMALLLTACGQSTEPAGPDMAALQRDMQEILASQNAMLERSGKSTDPATDALLTQKFETHLSKVTAWIEDHRNIECMYVDFKGVVEDPLSHSRTIQAFLQQQVDPEAMASAVDTSLYRNRVE